MAVDVLYAYDKPEEIGDEYKGNEVVLDFIKALARIVS